MSAVWAITASTLLCLPSCSEVREFTRFYWYVFLTLGTACGPARTHTPANLPMFRVVKPPVSSLSEVSTPSIWHLFLLFIFVFSSLIRPVWNKPSWAMLHTYTCAAAALGHTDLSDYVVFAALCGLFTSVMLVCATCSAMAGGVWWGVLCFCPDQLAEVGCYGDGTCCARSGIQRFLHFSKCTSAYCIKSLYMLAHAQGNRKNSCYWYIVVMWHGPIVPVFNSCEHNWCL